MLLRYCPTQRFSGNFPLFCRLSPEIVCLSLVTTEDEGEKLQTAQNIVSTVLDEVALASGLCCACNAHEKSATFLPDLRPTITILTIRQIQ